MATATATAPSLSTGDLYVELETSALERDPLHRRANVDPNYIRELKDSILSRSLIEPPVVRPIPDKPGCYYVSAGECRRRALVLGKIPRVWVIVRELSDLDVLEVQIHENKKRRDLHPMDEAELYEEMHKRGRSVELIADRLGIPAQTVQRRLKLCQLAKRPRELYLEGAISDWKALALAKIPVAEIQIKAAEDFARSEVSDEQAAETFARRYWLPIAWAPWDLADDKLDAQAGACVHCPTRSLSQRDLFADDLYARQGVGKKDDFCLNPACWQHKLDLHFVIAKGEAERAGVEVLAPQASAALFQEFGTPGQRRALRTVDYVDADGPSAIDPDKKWRDVVGEAPAVLARDPDGMPRALYPAKVARTAQRKAKPSRVADFAADERRASREQAKVADAETNALVEACASAAKSCSVNDLVTALVPAAIAALAPAVATVMKRRGLDTVDDLLKEAKGVPSARSILVELLLTEAVDQADVEPGEVADVLIAAAKAIGVDARAVRREARTAAKE